MRKAPLLLGLFLLLVPVLAHARADQPAAKDSLKKLGLSDTQVTQVLDVQKATRTQIQASIADLRIARAQLATLLLPANVDMEQVNKLLAKEQELRTTIARTGIEAQIKLRQIMRDDTYFNYRRDFMRSHRTLIRGWLSRVRGGGRLGIGMNYDDTGTRPATDRAD
jgi:hypothetical protein